MEHKKYLIIMITACVLILLLNWGVPKALVSAVLFLETGKVAAAQQTLPPAEETEPQPAVTEPTILRNEPHFSPEDLPYIRMQYGCDYRPDLETLLVKPLDWHLKENAPTVLILHTHATEGYAGTDGYRSQNPEENMVSIGAEIARVLEAGGIRVLHDTTFHDDPNYNTSYASARQTIQRYLAQHPSIQLVLDIHRDASDNVGEQMVTSATVGGQHSAQLMMVVGTDAGGNLHPNWQENLSLALKLTALLEQENPGICRPINLRSERFNMDLTHGSLLVEVGAAGNTREEALIAANALAQAVLALSQGANLS